MVRKLNKRELILLFIFIGLLLFALLKNAWLTPYFANREELLLEREKLQQQWEEIEIYKGKEAVIRNSLSRLEQERNEFRQIILAQQSSHKYWESILQQANDADVEILTMQEGEFETENRAMTTAVNVQGNFAAILKFIDSVKKIPYVLAVKEGSITEVEGGVFTASLSMDFYFSE